MIYRLIIVNPQIGFAGFFIFANYLNIYNKK